MQSSPDILAIDGKKIAYHTHLPARPASAVGVMFLGGFRSDMNGSKALFLDTICRRHRIPFVRFDYTGHGESSGTFEAATIGQWKEDALAVLDQITTTPQILIGSSMGGWIALLLALARPEKLAGFIGIAAAPDFTESLIWKALTPAQQKEMQQKGKLVMPTQFPTPDSTYPLTHTLITEARHHLLLDKPIAVSCPIRLLHGTEDAEVPVAVAHTLLSQLTSADATLTLIKDGDHRLSSPAHLQLLEETLLPLIQRL